VHTVIYFCLEFNLYLVEDIEMSLNDYKKALAILEHIVEPDHRRAVELYPQHFSSQTLIQFLYIQISFGQKIMSLP
jgi:hypothetical protein